MPTFRLKIECGNAAFEPPDRNLEVARILRDIATRLENDETDGNVRDVNGNTVGSFSFVGRR